MMNALTIISALKTLGTVGQRLSKLTEQGRFETARDNMVRETVWALEAAVKSLDASVQAAEMTDEQVVALIYPLWEQAILSATSERRRMLAGALAGMLHPDLAVETKSRLQRAISNLEPSDVRVLRILEATPPISEDGKTVPQARADLPDVSIETLTAVGCVMLRNFGNAPLVTEFGRTVLEFIGGAVDP
jgi:hypothetical protein